MRDHRNSRGALAASALAMAVASCNGAPTAQDPVKRGEYLVTIMGCADCHTPGSLLGMPDAARPLGGSDVSFFMPGAGYFYPPNLTPDPMTGLGNWTPAQIVAAIRTGVRPDGRMLAPIMPWRDFAHLTDDDANAVASYLKSMKPIVNQVPAPTAADQMPPGPSMAVVAPPGLTPVGLGAAGGASPAAGPPPAGGAPPPAAP